MLGADWINQSVLHHWPLIRSATLNNCVASCFIKCHIEYQFIYTFTGCQHHLSYLWSTTFRRTIRWVFESHITDWLRLVLTSGRVSLFHLPAPFLTILNDILFTDHLTILSSVWILTTCVGIHSPLKWQVVSTISSLHRIRTCICFLVSVGNQVAV